MKQIAAFPALLSFFFSSFGAHGMVWHVTAAASGDSSPVANGSYKPSLGTGRAASFSLSGGVKMFGGFAGTERALKPAHGEEHGTLEHPEELMHLRKPLITVLLLLLASSRALFAQTNLVLNGDFETYSKCPYSEDQIMLATGWTPIDTTKLNPDFRGDGNCSPDYCHTCGTGAWNTVPAGIYGFQYPHSGRAMSAVYMYTVLDSDQYRRYLRDYLQGRLTKKLTAGKRYCVSFYVVLAEISDWAVKDIGAYLDNGAIDNISYQFCGIPKTQYKPQVTYSGTPITDTLNWTKVEGSFIANGTEQFITIGNFKDKAGSTAIQVPPNNRNNGSLGTYYLIDDVSVVESTTKADAGPDTHVGTGDSVYIGRPQSAAIWCDWQVLGSATIIGKGPGIWVKPAKTTSYVMMQTLCGAVTKDTVKVEVWAAGVQSINGQSQQYSIVPNPAKGAFELVQSVAKDGQAGVSIVNAVGQRLYSAVLHFKGGRAGVDAAALPAGVYYLSIQTGEGYVWNMRFVRE